MTRRAAVLGLAARLLAPAADLPPLHRAAAQGEVSEVARLLDADPAGVRRFDDDGNLPLHHAAWNGHAGVAAALLDRGAVVDALRRDAHPTTALEMASYFGHEGVARLLLERGADPNTRVFEGHTALHKAAQGGHVAVMRRLLAKGARLDAATDDGRTALHVAVGNGRDGAARWLLAVGADPSARDRAGATPLGGASGACRRLLEEHLRQRAESDALRAARELHRVGAGKVREVFADRFTARAPGRAWSTSPLGESGTGLGIVDAPLTALRLLGPFGDQEVRLALGDLPPHTGLAVHFDLALAGRWEGDAGPHRFDVALLGGPNLLHTTFSLPAPDGPEGPVQAYPGDWTRDHHPGGTGSERVGGLGLQPRGDGPGSRDVLYRIARSCRHTGPVAVVRWSAVGLGRIEDASWHLAHVRVYVLSDPPRRPGSGPARVG